VAEADMRAAERSVGQTAGRMGLEPVWQAALKQDSHPADRSASLLGDAGLASTPARCAFQGRLGSLALRYPAANPGDAAPRLALAGLVLALAVAAAWGLRRLSTDRLARWLPILGIVAGLAWWWWLAPSALGLLLVVASAVALGLRHRVAGHAAGGSSIVELEALQR
jgi:hypothetical protein